MQKKPSSSSTIDLGARTLDLSLNRLKTGVDNIRNDVYFSAEFCKAVRNFIFQVMVKQTQTEEALNIEKQSSFSRGREQFRRQYREISLYAISRAKSERETQIDSLLQISVIKLLLDSLSAQFDNFLGRLKDIIRGYELSNNRDEAVDLEKKMFALQENREKSIHMTGREIFLVLKEVNQRDLNEMRRINFGERTVVPDAVFANPMLFGEDPFDDYFTLKHYEIMFGHRPEDPDRYEALLSTFGKILVDIREKRHSGSPHPADPGEPPPEDGWLKKEEQIDLLFNCFQTAYRCRSAMKSGHGEDARPLKKLAAEQKARLSVLCRELGRKGVTEKILAVYEMQPVYLDFCPPLVPQLIAQFLIDRRVRKNVSIRLRQLGKLYEKPFSMKTLHQIRWRIWWMRVKREYGYIIRFLKNFVQFHRDYQHYAVIRKAMAQINLTAEAKIVNLSRVNNTLHEFLLPHERRFQEKPIASHVILKADVRGSTTITHRMMSRDLNPASYFSLNFFDPITEILPDYGAEKVFVEGDAIILSIFEREDDPVGRYSVARACGLAASILSIVRNCNLRNEKYRLPNIELGIGITYAPGRPAFLFDGDQRIMISAAINIADRLSGCSKPLKQALFQKSVPFNLYVFQSVSDEAVVRTEDDIFLRFNVNGIELSEAGFQKLQEEIQLRPFTVNTATASERSRMKFHTAKFPLINGEYQRLVIREAPIVKIDAEQFSPRGVSRRKYYEICTNPKLRAVAESLPSEASL
ncbi:hypothetical protein [Desulfococcus sp.]|uniref:hypothetical protein n=1 Tax=Desulfococcus sp. TaxID=2025834 RepID=UPI0035931AD8